jgi:cytochrome b6-f complex iron-sulfur subunit
MTKGSIRRGKDLAKSRDSTSARSKEAAHAGLRKVQRYIGIALLFSALMGVYLLATDSSLWQVAFSHAVGLVAVVVIEAVLGVANLASVKKVFIPSFAVGCIGVLLQLGDIVTASQYSMTMLDFSLYLFGLWPFDLLLASQIAAVLIAVKNRSYVQQLALIRTRRGTEMSYSKRTFLKSFLALAGIIGISVSLGSMPTATSRRPRFKIAGPETSIVNSSELQQGSPVYFEYPQNYPNMLLKKQDVSLVALSMLCTHVCCVCSYNSSYDVLVCPCHESVFDLSGQVLRGPARQPLPTIQLKVDDKGDIFPTGVNGQLRC